MSYDEKYFDFQRRIGQFGGHANLFKFQNEIRITDDILDFGCGGGYLLKNIKTTGKKDGVEINPVARKEAEINGVRCFESINSVPDGCYDVIISNHALEHVDNPKEVLERLREKLKPGGKIVLVVPHEIGKKVIENDINMHLFTWSPQNLKNLVTICGFKNTKATRLVHSWPPRYVEVQKAFGWHGFNIICRMYGMIKMQYQTKVVAKKSD